MPTVRTGIVGAGFVGRLHGRLIAELPNGEVAGVVDTRPYVAAHAAEEMCARAYPRLGRQKVSTGREVDTIDDR